MSDIDYEHRYELEYEFEQGYEAGSEERFDEGFEAGYEAALKRLLSDDVYYNVLDAKQTTRAAVAAAVNYVRQHRDRQKVGE